MDFLKEITYKRAYYEEIISKARKSLKNAPEKGRLRATNNKGRPQYYLCMEAGDTKGEYLSKERIEIARAIAQRDYDKKVIECAEQWIRWIDDTCKRKPQYDVENILYGKFPARVELISPYEISDEEFVKQWEAETYEANTYEANTYEFGETEYYTDKGVRVRSKSESVIAQQLESMGIPYRYEYPLVLHDESVVYPDFTILHTKERKTVIFEHFGIMDSYEYASSAYKKIYNYEKSGYWPGDNFIFTVEDGKHPLDVRLLRDLLRRTFND